MKRFAVSTILAGGLFAGLLGAAGAAHAGEIIIGPDGAGVTYGAPARTYDAPNAGIDPKANVSLPFGANAGIGLGGANASLPLGMGDASIGLDGANVSLPFGVNAGIGLGGANASLPLGMGHANVSVK
jgi:hypothetical protein